MTLRLSNRLSSSSILFGEGISAATAAAATSAAILWFRQRLFSFWADGEMLSGGRTREAPFAA